MFNILIAPEQTPTITIPTKLFNEIFLTLGALPTSSKVAPVYEKMREQTSNTINKALTGENLNTETASFVSPEPIAKSKRVRNRSPLPAKAMAQEFIQLNPTATRVDVIKHLISKGVSDPVASSTVGKLMKK